MIRLLLALEVRDGRVVGRVVEPAEDVKVLLECTVQADGTVVQGHVLEQERDIGPPPPMSGSMSLLGDADAG